MNAATKSAALLAMTLAVGIALGLFGAGALDTRRRRPPPGPRQEGGFARHMEDVIQPRDPAQADLVRPVIEITAEHNRAIILAVNDSLRASIETMRAQLEPLIDDEQRRRLADATRALPPVGLPGTGGRGRGRGMGPGPGGGFGPPPMGGRESGPP